MYGYEYDPRAGNGSGHNRAPARPRSELSAPKGAAADRVGEAEVTPAGRCHVYAVYTQKRDVTRRLERILAQQGLRVAVLTADVPPEKREAWLNKRCRSVSRSTISHPKLIETNFDLLCTTV